MSFSRTLLADAATTRSISMSYHYPATRLGRERRLLQKAWVRASLPCIQRSSLFDCARTARARQHSNIVTTRSHILNTFAAFSHDLTFLPIISASHDRPSLTHRTRTPTSTPLPTNKSTIYRTPVPREPSRSRMQRISGNRGRLSYVCPGNRGTYIANLAWVVAR